MRHGYSKGFTLIELVIGIVVFAVAMVSFVSFLIPQMQRSADPHYQARAAALGQSFMNEIISKSYDHNSDHYGGALRCDTEGVFCTDTFGPDGSEAVGNYNDVDDYIGCWYASSSRPSSCQNAGGGNLSDVFGVDMSADYPNFRVEVEVTEHLNSAGLSQFKQVDMLVVGGSRTTLSFSAERGNY